MNFEELVHNIDVAIATKKSRGKNVWADFDIEIGNLAGKIKKYYIERGYVIEVRLCRGCLNQKADIIISW